jgi:hypothetical protein
MTSEHESFWLLNTAGVSTCSDNGVSLLLLEQVPPLPAPALPSSVTDEFDDDRADGGVDCDCDCECDCADDADGVAAVVDAIDDDDSDDDEDEDEELS